MDIDSITLAAGHDKLGVAQYTCKRDYRKPIDRDEFERTLFPIDDKSSFLVKWIRSMRSKHGDLSPPVEEHREPKRKDPVQGAIDAIGD